MYMEEILGKLCFTMRIVSSQGTTAIAMEKCSRRRFRAFEKLGKVAWFSTCTGGKRVRCAVPVEGQTKRNFQGESSRIVLTIQNQRFLFRDSARKRLREDLEINAKAHRAAQQASAISDDNNDNNSRRCPYQHTSVSYSSPVE
jgi:hypothetical protein